MKTQEQWVIAQLKKKGWVSRNQALDRRITRLASIIGYLKGTAYESKGTWFKTAYGKDYRYYLCK